MGHRLGGGDGPPPHFTPMEAKTFINETRSPVPVVERTTWGEFRRTMDTHHNDGAELPYVLQAWPSGERPGTYDIYRTYRFYERTQAGLSPSEVLALGAELKP